MVVFAIPSAVHRERLGLQAWRPTAINDVMQVMCTSGLAQTESIADLYRLTVVHSTGHRPEYFRTSSFCVSEQSSNPVTAFAGCTTRCDNHMMLTSVPLLTCRRANRHLRAERSRTARAITKLLDQRIALEIRCQVPTLHSVHDAAPSAKAEVLAGCVAAPPLVLHDLGSVGTTPSWSLDKSHSIMHIVFCEVCKPHNGVLQQAGPQESVT